MNKKKIIISILYLIGIIFWFIYFKLEFKMDYNMTLVQRLGFTLGGCIFVYLGSKQLCKIIKPEYRRGLMYRTFSLFFLVYLILLVTVTLFDPLLGRFGSITFNSNILANYFNSTANLELFRMIKIYWYGYINGIFTLNEYLMNMLGNIVLLTPMGFFLPLIFKKEHHFGFYLLTIFIIVMAIETGQTLLMSGYFDVDDIMLNTIGAVISYLLLNIKGIRSKITKLTYGLY